MTARRRALLAVIALAIFLLFAGRWTAAFLAERWWARQFSPTAASFLASVHLLRLSLDAAAVVLATGWFTGHLIIVVRAVSSVQIPRHVGNLEFREAVRTDVLLGFAVAAGVLLGLLLGLDTSAAWATVALAWRGVTTGVVEPLLGRDTGLYLAQLPLWQLLHAFAFRLVVLAAIVIASLYGVIGALRFERKRPAISDYARAHLGWLLVALALVLAWGYALEPFELVASAGGVPALGEFRRATITAPALIGTALMVAAISALWALQPRHALAAAAWAILLVASVGGRRLAPLVVPAERGAPAPDSTMRALQAHAFGLAGIDTLPAPRLLPAPLFEAEAVRRAFPAGTEVITVDAASVRTGESERGAWLVLTGGEGRNAEVVAVGVDRATGAGGPLFHRAGDSLSYPTPYPSAALPADAARPGAPRLVLRTGGRGVSIDSPLRQVALAWALQAGELLGPLPAQARVDWSLAPERRLAALAPFASWSSGRARLLDDQVLWIVDGYLSAEAYPLVDPVAWRGGRAGLVRASFVGVVDARSGTTRIYQRDENDPLAAAWAAISEGLIEAGGVPPEYAGIVGYPPELFAVQAEVLAARPDGPGRLSAGRGGAPAVRAGWDSGGSPLLVAAFTDADGGTTTALLTGASEEALRLVPIRTGLLSPRALERRWARFATFAPVEDSVVAAGGTLRTSDVSFWQSPEGIGAFQVHTAAREGARPAIVWVTVATGRRLGAARTLPEAWENLRGATAPAPPGAASGTLPEARHWMRLADEALRQSDWAAFGRAFDALRRVLQAEPE